MIPPQELRKITREKKTTLYFSGFVHIENRIMEKGYLNL